LSSPAAEVPADDEPAAPAAEEGAPIAAAAERTVVVETDLYRAELSNRGAVLRSFVLKEHLARDGGQVDLVRERPPGEPLPFALVDAAGEPLPLGDALFAVEETAGRDATTLTFRHRGPAGAAEKRFVFRSGGRFEVELDVERPESWALFVGPGLRNPSPAELENRYERRFAAWSRTGEVSDTDAREEEVPVVLRGGGLEWVALSDQYFVAAVRPRAGVAEAVLAPQVMVPAADRSWSFHPAVAEPPEEEEDLPREMAVLLTPADGEMALSAYWGAKDVERLAALDWGLEETVNFGIFGWLAIWLLRGLLWIHDNVVQNYGWAIVLMTLVIKVLLLPLSHHAMVSAQKMREIQPQMQALRAKWRGKLRDKNGRMNFEAQRKMNEEMRELTQKAGVNPAGGCLPMLLQMPVLFAFYYLLIAAVELRGADWMLWIHDLSVRDPYYVMPLVMGATQFLQMKMTPMSADPMQRRIMMMMPIVFTVFFLGFPAGLVLYWLTNNVLTIVQQTIYNRIEERRRNPPDAQPASAGGRRKSPKQVASK
ncbi:MAG TPA: membrane protein insertase YidC, partial [Thermoanaerobaculia bacterium]|nr:membrane protein insertase YidC [Thermoanaerobaculia bacterium]